MTTTETRTGTTTWQIDPAHSAVEFAVKHLMIATVKGHFAGVNGAVTIENDDLTTAKVDVTIDTRTVDTRAPDRDAHLRSPDFFDAERYPAITFRSTGVERVGSRLRIVGNLTIRDVTRPLVLDARDEGRARDPWGKDRAVFSASTKIRRGDFGLNWNQALETGGVLVGDEIKLSIDVELVKD